TARSRYLQFRRGVPYDCEPLEARKLEQLFAESGLCFERATGRAVKASLEIEGRILPIIDGALKRIPEALIDKVISFVPTLLYRFWSSEPVAMVQRNGNPESY